MTLHQQGVFGHIYQGIDACLWQSRCNDYFLRAYWFQHYTTLNFVGFWSRLITAHHFYFQMLHSIHLPFFSEGKSTDTACVQRTSNGTTYLHRSQFKRVKGVRYIKHQININAVVVVANNNNKTFISNKRLSAERLPLTLQYCTADGIG